MRKLFRNLIVRMGKREQEESGSKEITPEDRVRALRERTEAFEQKPPAEELVPARRPPLTAPPVPAHPVEEPPQAPVIARDGKVVQVSWRIA